MKKNMIIACSAIFGLAILAFGLTLQAQEQNTVNQNDNEPFIVDFKPAEFNYDIDNRFIKTVTKTELNHAKTITDLFSSEEIEGLASFKNVRVTLMPKGEKETAKEISEFGTTETFTTAQLSLLRSLDYSTNFFVEANCKQNEAENYQFVYYISVVPEKEAVYDAGNQNLLDYLKMNSQLETAGVDERKLWFGRVNFVISESGQITNVFLESTSGYKNIDEKMVKLITDLPGTWQPATNEKGEKVAQELVFSFGKPGGC